MEADIEPYLLDQKLWEPVELGALPTKAAANIAGALAGAERPLLITGYSGRNPKIPGALVELADTIKGLRVLDTGGSDMSFPGNHPAWLGLRYGSHEEITKADVILVLNCDVPWIPTLCKPRIDAKIFRIDVDPLKELMPLFYIQAETCYKADALTSIEQITTNLKASKALAAMD
jgi:thiamine pyrophosphate-dependent acetolactate synthase large subunit-like protein